MHRSFTISGIRVTHQRASVDDLEVAAPEDPTTRLEALLGRDPVEEAFVFETCNRVEEYIVTEDAETGLGALSDFAPGVSQAVIETTEHEESLRHLLRVAAGLESQVLGEDQVLGQLRSAYTTATEAGAVGPVLEPGLLKAIHVGERARTETEINEGVVSLGSAAVRLADRERGLADATVLVVGAGEMAQLVARALAATSVADLRLVNRSPERAAMLATELPVAASHDDLDALATHVAAAQVVISSTASRESMIDRKMATDAGETLFIDLAQPRDVAADVATVDGATVHDLDGLEAVTRATHRDRRDAAAAVEALIDEEFALLMDQYKRIRADAVISGMYQGAERIKRRELRTALARLGGDSAPSAADREIVEDLADALVAQLLAVPTRNLRAAAADDDWETVTSAIELFDPGVEDPRGFFEASPPSDEAAADASGNH